MTESPTSPPFALPLDDADPSDASAYDYALPEELIAHTPAERRESARLLTFSRKTGAIGHRHFTDLPGILRPGDRLIFNDTKVLPGRIMTHKKETGGFVELLVLDLVEHDDWRTPSPTGALTFECMTRSSKPLRPDMIVTTGGDDPLEFRVLWADAGRAHVAIDWERSGQELLDVIGQMPLPPYIVKQRKRAGLAEVTDSDRQRYQTLFADKPGAIAAPTAGLHFSKELLGALYEHDITTSTVTLHVGPGTFQPMHDGALADHNMHSERYVVPETLAQDIADTRAVGGRLIAVGTTSARVLEAEARRSEPFVPGERETDLFLHPDNGFEVCDGLVTNFHLPKSTLLTLVASLTGYASMRRIYTEAIARRYRFYSYGDGMVLLDEMEGAR